MPSLVKGREEEIQKDGQARGSVLLIGSAESGDHCGGEGREVHSEEALVLEQTPPEFHLS